jgi:alanine racemase
MNSLNRVQISRSALIHNYQICRQWADGAAIMPLVKADGYGHGMIECARIFASQGAAAFGVAEAIEGVQLRDAGITQPVLVLAGVIPQTLPTIIAAGLTPVVTDATILPELSRLAGSHGVEVSIHVKLDAGMGRQGVLPADFIELIKAICQLPHLRTESWPIFPCPMTGNPTIPLLSCRPFLPPPGRLLIVALGNVVSILPIRVDYFMLPAPGSTWCDRE